MAWQDRTVKGPVEGEFPLPPPWETRSAARSVVALNEATEKPISHSWKAQARDVAGENMGSAAHCWVHIVNLDPIRGSNEGKKQRPSSGNSSKETFIVGSRGGPWKPKDSTLNSFPEALRQVGSHR